MSLKTAEDAGFQGCDSAYLIDGYQNFRSFYIFRAEREAVY
jgi:hypothetical protein